MGSKHSYMKRSSGNKGKIYRRSKSKCRSRRSDDDQENSRFKHSNDIQMIMNEWKKHHGDCNSTLGNMVNKQSNRSKTRFIQTASHHNPFQNSHNNRPQNAYTQHSWIPNYPQPVTSGKVINNGTYEGCFDNKDKKKTNDIKFHPSVKIKKLKMSDLEAVKKKL